MKRRGRMERVLKAYKSLNTFLFLTFLVIFSLALIYRYLNIQADPMPGIDVATLTTFSMWLGFNSTSRIIKIETELDKLKKEGD